jgi:hypothetical protein
LIFSWQIISCPEPSRVARFPPFHQIRRHFPRIDHSFLPGFSSLPGSLLSIKFLDIFPASAILDHSFLPGFSSLPGSLLSIGISPHRQSSTIRSPGVSRTDRIPPSHQIHPIRFIPALTTIKFIGISLAILVCSLFIPPFAGSLGTHTSL